MMNFMPLSLIEIIGAVELGFIFTLVAIGVYLSFRTLQFPDMTVDGSFPLGGAVCATLIVAGMHPLPATLIAMVAGSLAGLLTAWLATHLKMLNLLAGILTMTALYSINIRVMGKPNVALLGEPTLFNQSLSDVPVYLALGIIILAAILLIYRFLSSRLGLALRATGSNPRMGRAQGINDHRMVWMGLSLSNALVALAGALFAQVHGFADVTMGVGTIIIGLAAVIVGEALFRTRTVIQALFACLFGAILYRLLVAKALNLGGQASDLNLITAVLVALAMLLPNLKASVKKMTRGQS